MNTRMSGAIGLSALLACAGVTHSDVLTFQPSSGDFHDEDNWLHSENNTGVPTHDDRIVIPDQKICDVVANGQVVSFTIDTMNIASGGTLNIDAGITLILQNDDDNIPSLGSDDHSKVDGTLNVGHQTNGGGTLVVKAMNDPEHVFAGNGTMLGLHATR